MSPQQLMALFRRHLVAVVVVLAVTVGLAYYLKHSKQPYVDALTIAYVAPNGLGAGDSFKSLNAMDQVMATYMASPMAEQQVRLDGGMASWSISLINLNNEDYPDYANPYSTVSATAVDAAGAQQTLSAVMQVLQAGVKSRQASADAPRNTWIRVQTIAPESGPIEQKGSSKRALAGLAVLAMLMAFMLAKFLDRHPMQLRGVKPMRFRRDPRVRAGSH